VLSDGGAALAGKLPGDALRKYAGCARRLRGGEYVPTAFAPHARIRGDVPGNEGHVVGKVGQLVDDDVGSKGDDRLFQRPPLEDVADDRFCRRHSQAVGFLG
jgi:hypothetical protein